ncbi:MAG: hypothetical protein MI923_26070 [Phycisphaerales bacterium]|nr:hypothetical protein [Phycisphaerales bacterium]
MFKWSCLALAVVAMGFLGWMVNDLRTEIKQATVTVNTQLPEILNKTRDTAETVAVLAEDVRQVRDLSGAADIARDKTLVAYADRVLDLIEASGGRVGLKKKLLGGGLKDVSPAEQWVVAARKEALWLVMRAKSREELLERLCKNKFGSDWHIQENNDKPVPLRDWISGRLADHP